jgi:hypothetical protein
VCVPGHDSPNFNGTIFLWYMINRKPPSWMTQVTWSTHVDCLQAESPSTCGLGAFWPLDNIYSHDQVTWIIHSGGFLIFLPCLDDQIKSNSNKASLIGHLTCKLAQRQLSMQRRPQMSLLGKGN